MTALLLAAVMLLPPNHGRGATVYQPALVSLFLTSPSVVNGTHWWWRDGVFRPSGLMENLENRPLHLDVVQAFTDSCGVIRHTRVSFADLLPYERQVQVLPVYVPQDSCLGWGFLERFLMTDGRMTVMGQDACKAISTAYPCRARVTVPVFVQP